MKAMHALYMLPYLIKKVRFSSKPTKRVNSSNASQLLPFFKDALHVYSYENMNFYLGSAFNSIQSKPYNLHINCASSEIPAYNNAINIDWKDTDDIAVHERQLNMMLEAVKELQETQDIVHILFTCWAGASRSVGALIYVLDGLNQPSTEEPCDRFDKLYTHLRSVKPSINISTALRRYVIQTMQKATTSKYIDL